jgi:predicted AlkP superfamily pyrophosphatase or phosphodiesterase
MVTFAAEPPVPKAKHVILIGLDGMGAHDFQQASAPRMKEMAKEGAISLKARCVLESSSSQNWMTMLTGALPIQHGVTSNEWEPNKHNIIPTLKNKAGFYPSIFDDLKTQRPEAKAYFFYEWDGLARMFDMSVPDKVVFGKLGVKMFYDAIDSFFADKPDFLFIDVDETDNAGHVSGHESKEFYGCITKYDTIIGQLTERLKKEQMLDDTVVIITSDHGGIKKGHGGDSSLEMEIPVILYGGTVTKGKVIEGVNLIADIAPTVAGLLGISMPYDCIGKLITAAFEP